MDDRDRRNIESARRLYAGSDPEMAALSPNIVWHVPGHNPVSGDYVGLAAYSTDMPARMAPLTRWDFTIEHVMPNGDHVMVAFRVSGERRGVTIDLRGGHLLRFDDDGRVIEGWGFAEDQDTLDRFFSA